MQLQQFLKDFYFGAGSMGLYENSMYDMQYLLAVKLIYLLDSGNVQTVARQFGKLSYLCSRED